MSRKSGKVFQPCSRDIPGIIPGNLRRDPGNSHGLLEFLMKAQLGEYFLGILILCPIDFLVLSSETGT